MRIDVVSFEVITIDKPISLVMDVLVTVILKALTVEVLAEGSVREVA